MLLSWLGPNRVIQNLKGHSCICDSERNRVSAQNWFHLRQRKIYQGAKSIKQVMSLVANWSWLMINLFQRLRSWCNSAKLSAGLSKMNFHFLSPEELGLDQPQKLQCTCVSPWWLFSISLTSLCSDYKEIHMIHSLFSSFLNSKHLCKVSSGSISYAFLNYLYLWSSTPHVWWVMNSWVGDGCWLSWFANV